MKRRRLIVFKCILFILFILQLYHLIYRAIEHAKHYPILIGAYCLNGNASLDYIENENRNDELNIQQCSLENIDACQHIYNQTLLFRLQSTDSFTSELNNLIRAFIYAINTRRRFLIEDQYWNYELFFNISQGQFSPWLPLSSYCLQRKFVHLINYKSNNKYIPEHLTVARDINEGFSSLNLIMKPLEDNNQTLKVKRTIAHYLWKTLNNDTRQSIDEYINKIQLDNITYAIHIHQGNHISIEKYINGIEYFINKQPQNVDFKYRIYVVNDEHNIIDQLRNLRPDWEFVQSYAHKQDIFNRLSLRTKLESTRLLLTDIEILSRIKYVVCTFSSNVCRFVQILREQEPDTVLSLDQEWYPQ